MGGKVKDVIQLQRPIIEMSYKALLSNRKELQFSVGWAKQAKVQNYPYLLPGHTPARPWIHDRIISNSMSQTADLIAGMYVQDKSTESYGYKY